MWIDALHKAMRGLRASGYGQYFSVPFGAEPNLSGFYESTHILKEANEEFYCHINGLRPILVSVQEKLKSVQDEYFECLRGSHIVAAELHDHEAVSVESLFDAEVTKATAQLREAEKPSEGNANCVPEIAQSAMERTLSVAMSDWADPNQRCAAITIALALIVCPEYVRLCKARDRSASNAQIILAFYKTVEIRLPQTGVELGSTFFHYEVFGMFMGKASPSPMQLDNLAVSYQDAQRNGYFTAS